MRNAMVWIVAVLSVFFVLPFLAVWMFWTANRIPSRPKDGTNDPRREILYELQKPLSFRDGPVFVFGRIGPKAETERHDCAQLCRVKRQNDRAQLVGAPLVGSH